MKLISCCVLLSLAARSGRSFKAASFSASGVQLCRHGIASQTHTLTQVQSTTAASADSSEADVWASLDAVQTEIRKQNQIAAEMIKLGQVDDALKAYNKIIGLQENTYLFKRGVLLFLTGKYEDALKQFNRDKELWETRFEDSGTEEAIWILACMKRMGMEVTPDKVPRLELEENRVVFNAMYKLFAGEDSEAQVIEAVKVKQGTSLEYLGQYYLGLWHESLGNVEQAKAYYQNCFENPGLDKNQDIWYYITKCTLSGLQE
uniref:Uncharacterized protein n=1 Tax=Fibrocapsa japonica TaxID=94617 RepID=A0A7S2Y0Z0_9STRA|mmetsp:Transcript_9715/g.14935  ORF Transcript_9715/g.14935 Transcript_9715/m.14935 type:complete len:261 (+) Transcript_9715:66-848(+)